MSGRAPPWSSQRTTRLRYRTDGSGYTVNTPSHVFVTDAASGKTTQLTDGECEHWDVSWHPAGSIFSPRPRGMTPAISTRRRTSLRSASTDRRASSPDEHHGQPADRLA